MPKTLAADKTKFTILTVEPADPTAPTAAELNAGIDATQMILKSDFAWGATDSDKVNEPALDQANNANAVGASNYTAGISVWRYFDGTTGQPGATGDEVFAAIKTKDTDLWCYARQTGQLASEAWASGDEIYLGAHVITDSPQPPTDLGGFIKRRVPMEVQEAYPDITVA